MSQKTPITYFGGKQLLAQRILGMIPSHKIYCEPYFGGGAVFFAKGKSWLEVINDTNSNLMTFYRVCQNDASFRELQQLIQRTLHSESEYLRAEKIYRNPMAKGVTEMDVAWAVWMQTNMSYSAAPSGGWQWNNGSSGSHAGILMDNLRNRFTDAVFERLRFVQISCRDALVVISQRDSADTFFYLDPPYFGSTQKHYHGFTKKDMEVLLNVLENIKGKFLLSSFPSPLLQQYVKRNGWKLEQLEMASKITNFHDKPSRKTELFIYNYEIEPRLFDNE